MQRIPSIWVCFTTQGVIQNGFVFRYQTHTPRHFILESPPPPTHPSPSRAPPHSGLLSYWHRITQYYIKYEVVSKP